MSTIKKVVLSVIKGLASVIFSRLTKDLTVFCLLRANVTNGQTFGDNSSKINSAHILMLGRP